MKIRHMLNLLGGGLLFFSACGCISGPSHSGSRLIWNDEFSGIGLPDSTKWNYDVGGHGYGNNEAQFYTKNRLENARVENGKLIIEARKEQWKDNKYTSARLLTKGKFSFQYGTVEVKAKLPKGRGTWPAIWMMSEGMKKWPDDGELDIMEHVGYHQGYIHASVHTKKYNHIIGTQKTDTLIVKDASEKFHVYKAVWTPEKIDVYVDKQKYFTYENNEKTYESWPFDQPYFIILNLAIGGFWGGKEGIDDRIFPQKFEIDYVRVYQNR
ncbi:MULTISPECIES: glycoside hydrolase family 16 protein [Chryseobacterium]|uniref:Beta-glucanase (GH16 family) n=1 Tax=Chryseobacterium camelliae TaxID=1265445 RepID=A0ABU0TG47_9FLAO|nr:MULTISPECIES: glycoside hydrolase family 16 protein [Chryseobacterium]MDT3406196.1 beta-glucanase (GH16 family) [Pseudacidovorax intermedius]MDQ1096002.1 beta-glucanase (GH16 family) [Chryseobacterium camelliae]MDQ1099939.1 beta-glucanase (GH16 family) [Chryseobacterium sp. SORGH_AS_1048]MDR6087284.1 beta-glucanase (GH16 family) [Chryseobacterium sp. SORGH_AS_0909]MDR6131659.1 beta-glucanase (GH16 family) [Chryseobacterium sp. SORGH_AS_1175]